MIATVFPNHAVIGDPKPGDLPHDVKWSVDGKQIPTEGQLVLAARRLLIDLLNERSSPDRPRSEFVSEQVDAAKFVLISMIAEPE